MTYFRARAKAVNPALSSEGPVVVFGHRRAQKEYQSRQSGQSVQRCIALHLEGWPIIKATQENRTTSRPKLSRTWRRRDTLPPHFRPAVAEPWAAGADSREGLPMIRATLSCACVVAVFCSVQRSSPCRQAHHSPSPSRPTGDEGRPDATQLPARRPQRLRAAPRRAHARQRRVRDRPLRLDGRHTHRAGTRGGAAAIRRLDGGDIASVVVFDDKVDLLVQAQAVYDHAAFVDRVRQVTARGSTAIHGGVIEGAQQVRANFDSGGSTAWCCCRTARPMSVRAVPRISPNSDATLLQQDISVSPSGSACNTTRT